MNAGLSLWSVEAEGADLVQLGHDRGLRRTVCRSSFGNRWNASSPENGSGVAVSCHDVNEADHVLELEVTQRKPSGWVDFNYS
jgi:hypothetical protein